MRLVPIPLSLLAGVTPVQGQFRGDWDMWRPPNDDPRMGALLAHPVGQFLKR